MTRKLEAKIDRLEAIFEKRFDELAIAVKVGFDEVHEIFKVMNKSYALVADRFDRMDQRFDRLEATCFNHGNRIEALEEDVEIINNKINHRRT